MYREIDTCPAYGEIDICPAYGEIETCPAYGEIDICPAYGEIDGSYLDLTSEPIHMYINKIMDLSKTTLIEEGRCLQSCRSALMHNGLEYWYQFVLCGLQGM